MASSPDERQPGSTGSKRHHEACSSSSSSRIVVVPLFLPGRDWLIPAPLDELVERPMHDPASVSKLVVFANHHGEQASKSTVVYHADDDVVVDAVDDDDMMQIKMHRMLMVDDLMPHGSVEVDLLAGSAYRGESDQAGLWLSSSDGAFIKASIIFRQGDLNMSVAIIVEGHCDVSYWPLWHHIQAQKDKELVVGISATWTGSAIKIEYLSNDKRYEVRNFTWKCDKLSAGIYCAAPRRKGFFAEFLEFRRFFHPA